MVGTCKCGCGKEVNHNFVRGHNDKRGELYKSSCIFKNCFTCNKIFKIYSYRTNSAIFCSRKCRRHNLKTKEMISTTKIGHPLIRINYKHSRETLNKMSEYGKKHPVNYWLGKHRSIESRQKMSRTHSEKISDGRIVAPYSNCSKHGHYKNEYYDSSWELIYMKYLDSKRMKWTKKHHIYIPYKYDNNEHNYIPDFLVNNNELHEIKPFFKLCDKNTELKFLAAKNYCETKGMTFKIITEKNFDFNNLIKIEN